MIPLVSCEMLNQEVGLSFLMALEAVLRLSLYYLEVTVCFFECF